MIPVGEDLEPGGVDSVVQLAGERVQAQAGAGAANGGSRQLDAAERESVVLSRCSPPLRELSAKLALPATI